MTTSETRPRRVRRTDRLSHVNVARRRADVEAAQAMNQLEGGPAPSANDQALAALWIDGKISTGEYLARCR